MSTEGPPETTGQQAAREYAERCRRPSYGLCRICRNGHLHMDTIGIREDVIEGVLLVVSGLLPGRYAVRARTYVFRRRLPDWGCLTVRGPGRWVLRRRGGGQVVVPDGFGGVIVLRLWRGYA